MRKIVLLILASATVVSCSDSGSGSSQIEGNDFSGQYSMAGIECYSTTTYTNTDVALITGYTDQITITGNTITSETTSGGCSSSSSGRVVFHPNNIIDLSNTTYTSVTGGACTSTINIGSSPVNDISPTSISTSLSTGMTTPNQQSNWLRNSTNGAIGILSVFKTTDSSDLCFMIYTKN